MILIISSNDDDHADAVLKQLTLHKAEAALLDLSMFPQQISMAVNYNELKKHSFYLNVTGQKEINLKDCNVIWWRRPQPFNLHPEIKRPSQLSFAYNECIEAFTGLWHSLDVFWVNHPLQDERAAHKVYQLRIAQDVGLKIPTTLVSNNIEKVKEFIGTQGVTRTIYKSFSATEQEWRETRILRPEELQLIDNVKYAPVIFQEYIEAKFDLRVTILGKEFFTAAIYSQETSYKADFRMDWKNAHVEPFQLPEHIEKKICLFMNKLGLTYGAVDMRLTPEDDYVFLEINPAGQWRFIESRTNQPITTSFTNLLVEHDRNGN